MNWSYKQENLAKATAEISQAMIKTFSELKDLKLPIERVNYVLCQQRMISTKLYILKLVFPVQNPDQKTLLLLRTRKLSWSYIFQKPYFVPR